MVTYYFAEITTKDAINLAGYGTTDLIGVAFAGSKEKRSKIVVDHAREMEPTTGKHH